MFIWVVYRYNGDLGDHWRATEEPVEFNTEEEALAFVRSADDDAVWFKREERV